MATFLGFVILGIMWAALKAVLYVISVPFRFIRMLSGGTFRDPPEEKKTWDDIDPFDYWMDDQGL